MLLKTFVGVAVAIVALDVAIMLAHRLGLHDLRAISFSRMAGLSQNANAFAFMLLLAVGVVVAGRWPRNAILLGILGLGLWYAGSRAAFIALPMILAAALYLRALSWPMLARALGVFAGLLAVVATVPYLGLADPNGVNALGSWPSTLPVIKSTASDTERWRTLLGGWEMFLSHPLFGAGLGAYMKDHGLVIHSVPLWIMAEMGLAGVIVMSAPILTIFLTETRRPYNNLAGVILVLTITAFTVFGLFHEIMYQRAFWLILGAAAAYHELPRKCRQIRRP